MGTIKKGILGGVSGKVGTIVGVHWKSSYYIRAHAAKAQHTRISSPIPIASTASRITIIAWINIDMDDLLSQSFGYELSSEADDFLRLTCLIH